MSLSSYFQYSMEVAEALREKRPIVALESTIISHGMPWPQNLQCGLSLEESLRKDGVIPATIALYKGKIRIGLEQEQLQDLAQNPAVKKASLRDIPGLLQNKAVASTTVSATMYCAHKAGLAIFVTGGIGGVHPHVAEHFDISADIVALSQIPMTVICAGAKAILDLPKTLEMLETWQVPVCGYQCDYFPAFYSSQSPLALSQRLDSPEEVAERMILQQQLQWQSALLLCNPIPKAEEIPYEEIFPSIEQAIEEAKSIQGKEVTPFLLRRINELTQGRSLQANLALIKNNTNLGAKIAHAYQNQKNSCQSY